jgi:thymidylate synthase
MTKFDQLYINLVEEILQSGHEDYNERSGFTCKSIPGAHFKIDLINDGFPLLTLRKIPLKIFIAEQIWFIQGENNPAHFLQEFTNIWDAFIDDDGTLKAAYGYRWRKHFGRDQLGELIEHLKDKPGSRHGVIVTWDPADDSLVSGTPKGNVPCPYTFTVNIIGGRLHLHNIIRSNDVFLGLPHDVAGFALLQLILAAKLGIEPGIYSHSISNAHFYSDQYDAAAELVKRSKEHKHNEIKLRANPDYFERAEKGDKQLVYEIENLLAEQYNPLSAIRGIRAH